MMGLHFIRIEFSGIKQLDELNKNINTSNFNAALSICIIILIIFGVAPLLNWFIFEANFFGDSKEACTGDGACWVYIKVWFNRFMYGMYPNAEQWRVNATFIAVLALGGLGYIFPLKLRKYLTFYYVIFLPIISFLLISTIIVKVLVELGKVVLAPNSVISTDFASHIRIAVAALVEDVKPRDSNKSRSSFFII